MPGTKLKTQVKAFEPFTQVIQGPKETFTDFIQRLTSAIDWKILDPLIKKALIKHLVF